MDDVAKRTWKRGLGTGFGIAFGIGTQVLFFATVWYLFWYLRDGVRAGEEGARATDNLGSLSIDALLSLQFAVIHSLLLLPPTRSLITRVLPGAFYGLLFCTATSTCLLVQIACWRGSSVVLWQAEGAAAAVIHLAFYLSWILMLYSISLTGFGYQTGWTPWWHWLRGTPLPRRGFATHGAYRWLRHPVYLSFLGLIWFTPRMTLDHALLTGLWTVYIFVGSYLKDQRLVFYLGDRYREYWSRVPGYPLMPFGPLATRRGPAPAESPPAVSAS